jgi:hypothetical protein
MSAKSTAYEKFVRSIMQALLNAQGLDSVAVQHDVHVPGFSGAPQVDVYWEYRLGGMRHRVVIDCKCYGETVEVGNVRELKGVLDDMPGVLGMLATTIGYQSGAVDYAKTHGIGLKVIRPPQDEDYDGRIREIQLATTLVIPELLECKTRLDRDWIVANVPGDPDALAGTRQTDARTTVVRDLATGVVESMGTLFNRAMKENPARTNAVEGSGVLRWKDARLERPGAIPLKVNEVEFRWRLRSGETETEVIRSDPRAIVRDAISGTLLFIDPDGTVTGDVADELG